jgi:type II secretory pathway pseudopilin PulG
MKKLIKIKNNAGMSYVELIVVLSIFAVISSIVIFNYGDFQAKVDIKNLASDIALQVVQAQKSSLSGLLPTSGGYGPDWKPSYGVYFDITTPKQFIYFVDLNNANGYETGEALNTVNITKNNSISRIDSYVGATPTQILTPLSIVFKRPDSGATFILNGLPLVGVDYVQITVASPGNRTSLIKLYPSGRVQVN